MRLRGGGDPDACVRSKYRDVSIPAPLPSAFKGASVGSRSNRTGAATGGLSKPVGNESERWSKLTTRLYGVSEKSGEESACSDGRKVPVPVLPFGVTDGRDVNIAMERTACLASSQRPYIPGRRTRGSGHGSGHQVNTHDGPFSTYIESLRPRSNCGEGPSTAWGVDVAAAMLGDSGESRKVDPSAWEDISEAYLPASISSAPRRGKHEKRLPSQFSLVRIRSGASETSATTQSSEDTAVLFVEEPGNDKEPGDDRSSEDIPDTPSLRAFDRHMRPMQSHRSLRDTFHDVLKGLQQGSWSTARGKGKQTPLRAPIPNFVPAGAVDTKGD